MEQSPYWEANRWSASQEFPCILWKPKFHLRIHKYRPPAPVLSQINAFHALHPTYWRSILILSSYVSLGLPSGLLPSVFHTKTLYTPLLSPIRATCPTKLILVFITRIILGEEYRTLSSSCIVFPLPYYLVPLRPSIFSAPYSQTPSSWRFFLKWETKFHTNTKQQAKL